MKFQITTSSFPVQTRLSAFDCVSTQTGSVPISLSLLFLHPPLPLSGFHAWASAFARSSDRVFCSCELFLVFCSLLHVEIDQRHLDYSFIRTFYTLLTIILLEIHSVNYNLVYYSAELTRLNEGLVSWERERKGASFMCRLCRVCPLNLFNSSRLWTIDVSIDLCS